MINYTIIIPHYKSLDTLPRLLSSIPDRHDIQVVVIDDNSGLKKDDFKSLPSFFDANFSIIFLSENKGAGSARNEGIKIANGKWLIFADSDDYFAQNAFQNFDTFLNDDSDIVYFRTESVDLNNDINPTRGNYYNQLVEHYSPDDIKSVEKLRFNHGVPWSKMVKKELVTFNNIKFDTIKYSNDVMFSTKIGYYARKIKASNHIVYCVNNNGSGLTSNRSKEALLCRYETALRQNKFLRDIGKSTYQKSIMSYLRLSLHYGIPTLIQFIKMGINIDADFSVGMFHWHEYLIRKIQSK